MSWRALAVGAAGAWVAYAWGAHLFTAQCVRRGDARAPRIALTFDDGPDPVWTPRVLDLLAARDVRASFFVVGERAARAPDVVRSIARAGHDVGSHGWSHKSLWLAGPRATAVEIGRTHAFLSDLLGREPRHFRPPWGMVNLAMFPLLRRLGLSCVLWSIQPEGLRPVGPLEQSRYVVGHAHAGAIVDLHDAEGTPRAPERLSAALPQMTDGLRDAGWELTTLGELLGHGPRDRGKWGASKGPRRPPRSGAPRGTRGAPRFCARPGSPT
ncbi:MAG: polysaccharide deacetylase family protein [Candidatus Rokubacteria bacterium]|nr:polysaccharide deacetylase family protein [Candidatus Rokubacteria bacterium]